VIRLRVIDDLPRRDHAAKVNNALRARRTAVPMRCQRAKADAILPRFTRPSSCSGRVQHRTLRARERG